MFLKTILAKHLVGADLFEDFLRSKKIRVVHRNLNYSVDLRRLIWGLFFFYRKTTIAKLFF